MKSFLILLLLIATTTFAEIRYVSKTGNSTPPYTSWETAADSIQKCIDICNFGDTIYVANGRYKEQIVSKRGLTFIGGGIDSCIIDTKVMAVAQGFYSVQLKDSCTFKNFKVETSDYHGVYYGDGIETYLPEREFIVIEHNKIERAGEGIDLSEADGFIRHNIISTVHDGIVTGGITPDFYPVFESNYISARDFGIRGRFGSSPTYRNNVITITREGGVGYHSGPHFLFAEFTNNIIQTKNVKGREGIDLIILPTKIFNNVILGDFEVGIHAWDSAVVKNNVIIGNSVGINIAYDNFPIVQYNNSWNNDINYSNFTPDSTNISVDPMFVNEDSLDLHLQLFSALIDAGDPSILDVDGSRSDIGVHGGPYGSGYTYLDLPPKPPANINALLDSGIVALSWNKNSESDFKFYKVYRDTINDFVLNSGNLIIETTSETFSEPFLTNSNTYYKITASDKTGNESEPGEQAAILITNVGEPEVSLNDYLLYSNYPNPFNPSTTISYQLRKPGHVRLVIYNLQGELVEELENSWQPSGYHRKNFNTRGKNLASGIYLYKLEIKNDNNLPVYLNMKKMILLK